MDMWNASKGFRKHSISHEQGQSIGERFVLNNQLLFAVKVVGPSLEFLLFFLILQLSKTFFHPIWTRDLKKTLRLNEQKYQEKSSEPAATKPSQSQRKTSRDECQKHYFIT